MAKRRTKKKRRVSRLRQARVADEFDPRAYFMSLPPEQRKPPLLEADFDAREYFLNGGGGE
jgi:hypothetical protein